MRDAMRARLPGKAPHRSMCRSSSTRSSPSRIRPISAFEDLHAIPPQLLAEGYLARAVHGERLTLAVVEVEPGAALPEHQHDHEQFAFPPAARTPSPVGKRAPLSSASSLRREQTGAHARSWSLGQLAGRKRRRTGVEQAGEHP
jgi:hypothetical protein